MRPHQFPIDSKVVYTAPDDNNITEYGVVTSTNQQWVFVRYDDHKTSQATHPDNLQIVGRPAAAP